jgi:uncharacterized delta-60 repeat protein
MKRLFPVRTIILAGSLLLQPGAFPFHSHAAPGDVDLSFDPGSGVNGTVRIVALQPDGKVIIGGEFTTVKGLARLNVARLNADGSGDATFNPGTNAIGQLVAVALQSDGKVLITVRGNPAFKAARLNSDGNLDGSFLPQQGEGGPQHGDLTAVVEQPDGKVLFGGFVRVQYFDEENQLQSYERLLIYRTHPDGTVDNSFNYDNSAITYGIGVLALRCLVLQPDGKVLLGGFGSLINGTNHQGIARLNLDGSADTTFDPGTGTDENGVSSIALQSDGKVVIGGFLAAVNGTARNRIARLNADGGLDTGFDPGLGADLTVFSVALQPDGKVLIGGFFESVNGTSRNKIARLNVDGSLDAGFDPGSGTDRIVHSVVVQPDGRVLIGGNFTAVNATNRERMARLNADGTVDSSFHPGAALNGTVASLAVQPDGKTLIGGAFTSVNGTSRNRIARLNPNGSLDRGFEPGLEFDGALNPTVESVVPQADGRVLIGGVTELTAIGTNPPVSLARLYPDGTVDSGFSPPDAGPFVHAIALQADGKLLIGTGLTWGEVDEVIRLDADGSRDAVFNAQVTGPVGSIGDAVISLTIQPDGKVLAGGYSVYPGEELYRPLLNRLHADGTRDTSFEQLEGEEFYPTVILTMALQPDGKVLVGGDFTLVKGASRNGIARLNADGTLDHTFDPGTGIGTGTDELSNVNGILVQPDGRILIGGWFSTFNGTVRNGIARLNADGSLDTSFNPGAGADGVVRAIALQADGKMLIGGDFTTVNGVPCRGVARLHGDSLFIPSLAIAGANSFLTLSWPASATVYHLEESTNLSLANSWSLTSQPAVTNAGQVSVTVPTTAGGKFFRLNSQ